MTDADYMKMALEQAHHAGELGEVPVGAVLVFEDQVIARAHNLRELGANALAHAEVLCIQQACENLERWRLWGCTLYVTLEPCLMCAGAIINSRIERIVIGALDPKAGAVQSLYQTLSDPRLNHRPKVEVGLLQEECSQVLKDFFKMLREQK